MKVRERNRISNIRELIIPRTKIRENHAPKLACKLAQWIRERATSSTFNVTFVFLHRHTPNTDNVRGGIGWRMEGGRDAAGRGSESTTCNNVIAASDSYSGIYGRRTRLGETCKWNISEPWCNKHGHRPNAVYFARFTFNFLVLDD